MKGEVINFREAAKRVKRKPKKEPKEPGMNVLVPCKISFNCHKCGAFISITYTAQELAQRWKSRILSVSIGGECPRCNTENLVLTLDEVNAQT